MRANFSVYGFSENVMNNQTPERSAQRKPKVLGTGLIALDIVINAESNREPYYWAGGTCGNVMTILSFLGWHSFPVARLNGDTASRRVIDDFKSWNVALDFAATEPTAETPIIIHTISRDKAGHPRHKFSFNCPHCGAWLPSYKAVLASTARKIALEVTDHQVFFFDRASRASITLAQESAKNGALVVFEPVSVSDPRLFREALTAAHVLKYSNERFPESPVTRADVSRENILLEIQTLGEEGLRYRSRLPFAEAKKWTLIESPKITHVKDTAGAGDWCTAGIIEYLGKNGLRGFERISTLELEKALQFGETLAAWNCQFEGARGGMYQLAQEDHDLKFTDLDLLKKSKQPRKRITDKNLILSEENQKAQCFSDNGGNHRILNSSVKFCCL